MELQATNERHQMRLLEFHNAHDAPPSNAETLDRRFDYARFEKLLQISETTARVSLFSTPLSASIYLNLNMNIVVAPKRGDKCSKVDGSRASGRDGY